MKGSSEFELDIADANINLNAVLYKKRAVSVDSKGSLSGAAIAGAAPDGRAGRGPGLNHAHRGAAKHAHMSEQTGGARC